MRRLKTANLNPTQNKAHSVGKLLLHVSLQREVRGIPGAQAKTYVCKLKPWQNKGVGESPIQHRADHWLTASRQWSQAAATCTGRDLCMAGS